MTKTYTPHPQLLTRMQVAKRLNVSPRTVKRYEDRKILHPIHFGRSVRYNKAEIEALCNN